MSTAPLSFTGISTFSNDFQTILQREVAIAQLPIKALQNTQTDNLSKKQALIALDPAVASLGSAVAALGAVAASQGLVASSSDFSTVSVVSTGASTPATYTISNILSLASAASETSLKGYTDSAKTPVSTAGLNQVDLVVGSKTYHLDLTKNNSLTGLRDAINNSGAGVTAAILTTSNGNYLSLSASSIGATTLTLNDIPSSASLLSSAGTGTETSLTSYADHSATAVSTTGHLDLTLGSSTYHLDVSNANNLNGLVAAINASGAAVTASIDSGNHLQIVTNNGQPAAIGLSNTQASLISKTNQGSNSDFILNGIHVTEPANAINDVVPGLSFTLLAKTTGSVNLSLASDGSQLSSALQTFVQSYNAVVDQVNQQVGPSAGFLGGDLVIRSISDDMRQLSSYFGNGTSIRSLSDVGVTFDTTGHMAFDQTAFSALSGTQVSDAFKFFGSSKSGFGAMASNFTQLTDPTSGLLRIEEDGIDKENKQITDRVNVLNDRVRQVQATMTAQLQKADALVAQLQSEQNLVNASIQSVNFVAFGKIVNSNGQ
jgi:flagellar hook-associated protein 2